MIPRLDRMWSVCSDVFAGFIHDPDSQGRVSTAWREVHAQFGSRLVRTVRCGLMAMVITVPGCLGSLISPFDENAVPLPSLGEPAAGHPAASRESYPPTSRNGTEFPNQDETASASKELAAETFLDSVSGMPVLSPDERRLLVQDLAQVDPKLWMGIVAFYQAESSGTVEAATSRERVAMENPAAISAPPSRDEMAARQVVHASQRVQVASRNEPDTVPVQSAEVSEKRPNSIRQRRQPTGPLASNEPRALRKNSLPPNEANAPSPRVETPPLAASRTVDNQGMEDVTALLARQMSTASLSQTLHSGSGTSSTAMHSNPNQLVLLALARRVEELQQSIEGTSSVKMANGSGTSITDREKKNLTASSRSTVNVDGELTWNDRIRDAIWALQDELRASENGGISPEEKHVLAHKLHLLQVIAGQIDEALEPIEGLTAAEQEFWNYQLHALDTLFDSTVHSQQRQRTTLAAQRLRQAATKLGEAADLEVRNLAFCSRVESFGIFERLSDGPDEFAPGNEVLLYAELGNFVSQQGEDGQFHTRIKSEYRIVDEQGNTVDWHAFEPQKEQCQNQRHDFFVSYQIRLPEDLPLGGYQLKLKIMDLNDDKEGEQIIPFTIRGSRFANGN